jgi:hypothetical protein
MKKVTLSTIKSFLKKNEGQILIKVDSKFDSMTDCVERVNDGFTFAKKHNGVNSNYTLGLDGAWFVGSSRDYFKVYEDEKFQGFYIYNCCGSFTIAKLK